MPNENVKLWLDALRSGEYKQGTMYLNSNEGLCCLGVACEVYQKHVGDLETTEKLLRGGEDHDATVVIEYDGAYVTTPKKVMRWLGLRGSLGQFEEVVTKKLPNGDGTICSSTLSAMNDRAYTFAEIADHIESNPAGLFTE